MSMIREPGNLLKILCIASGESVLQSQVTVGFLHRTSAFFGRKGRRFLLPVLIDCLAEFWPMNEIPPDRYKERKLFL